MVVKGVLEQKDIEQLIEFAENERERVCGIELIDFVCLTHSAGKSPFVEVRN